MSCKLYDKSNKKSIYNYSKKMVGKTFQDLIDLNIEVMEDDASSSYGENARKGSLGNLIEEVYFGYKSNSLSEPDFKDAGLELKLTPYKINKDGSKSSKERMSITMIDYFKLVEEEFYESGLWKQIEFILIVFYLWDKDLDKLNYRIDYTYLYTPLKEDLEIIKDDYNKIKTKVENGKAHELSEGDTLYLGAATKGASSKALRQQPYSEKMAMSRAFSFKNSYMTYILNNYILDEKNKQNEQIEKIRKNDLKETFEEYVLNKINMNMGLTDLELIKKYYNVDDERELNKVLLSKGIYSNLAFRMLDIGSNSAEEFIKGNIVVKSIRVNRKNKIVESMSFPAFSIGELIDECWEKSTIYEYFSETKLLLVIYDENIHQGYTFRNAKFWNMPLKTIENELKSDWMKVVNKFKAGINFECKEQKNGNIIFKNDLPKKNELNLLEVRPHASKAYYEINGKEYGKGKKNRDSDILPNGDRMTKQCFWLQNKYLEDILLFEE